jgi:hypothetical protein
MADVRSIDGYDEAAAAKLWALLPAVYRAADSQAMDEVGPLQELLARIGHQVGAVRRNLDRLWEDQSIESCDDWVIPYIAALVDTNLVPAMDRRGQRLDVANTIAYRRRKGTLGLVEQLAADVTGWESRAVEMFRRLARTRHNLDPAIGRPADAPDPGAARRLQYAEGLAGLVTSTPTGGFADLRSAPGAAGAHGPFDEYHHFTDVRADAFYGIPKLGLFLWQLVSLPVDRATPVAVSGCSDHYAFDPTGRQIPLFQADDRPSYGEGWKPLTAAQVPGPISPLDAIAPLWPLSLAVRPLDSATPLDPADVEVWPEVGRFKAPGANLEVSYHHGLFSRIGAGGYDRRRIGIVEPVDPAPVTSVRGGALPAHLHDALAALAPAGTIVVSDGLTCTSVADVSGIEDVAIRADDAKRAVIRLERGDGPWVLEGTGTLRLEGLLFSGEDVVLRGEFEHVIVSCCTLDPGNGGEVSVDGRDLDPTTLWIEGTVERLTVDRCITGPIATRLGGIVEEVCASDSILHGDHALATGGLVLDRCTVLGKLDVHRLECSESILDDVAVVANVQDGCVRFSAWATGSELPRKYECVRVAPRAPLFVTRRFGEAHYAQLDVGADAAILGGGTAGPPSVRAGSHNGSEMGAFCRDAAAIKERSLLIKLKEYLPVGLTPVLVPMPPPDAEAETTRGKPWPST